ncbi:MAG: bifunctional 5,10-methylene-tetrahydrofolate dehydrogenase/ 5,10-methylene-tetrahydrofolate cyclohydrolase [Arenicellales bacterium IbO2]|nr:bifunctional methylenetetrahydrofolate dehydrogenase/methenyltetrahydrofolate cyclohydrolase FolD [Gammaproteobacteria bacterium]MDA7995467.1 bifunctional methylenetetrahydrofolate dehydrogenase/methenyltetrahydrofolate cyclohydrolase FolD [Gammaproteobacteria bacterium]CAJ2375997.1 MAG: bifunctional 5,10-methylene-tetrahydrofolate dehydrogenase/ 5,10-methylene-tetrahydrofolate cyclohydrolase [Arenicellales bacterium IbO2]
MRAHNITANGAIDMSSIIDGKAHAARLRERVGEAAAALAEKHGVTPGLTAVLVGDDPASEVYVRSKGKQTRAAGMASFERRLPAQTGEEDLLKLVGELNNDDAVDGILVQLPLPKQIRAERVINAIHPQKDVDGFHIENAGALAVGADALLPCTPFGCILLLKEKIGDMSGMHAVVVGRSNIVGKPVAMLLLREHCTVTIAHSRTRDLPEVCRRADILIAAAGRAEMIKGDWIKPGAVVIDVGINRVGDKKLVGDVEFDAAMKNAAAVTPVPGGVGPMTIACLLRNTLVAACRRRGISVPESLRE